MTPVCLIKMERKEQSFQNHFKSLVVGSPNNLSLNLKQEHSKYYKAERPR